MTTRKKFMIGTGIVLALLLGLGIYGNNQINKIIDTVAQSGLVEFGAGSPGANTNSPNKNPATATDNYDAAVGGGSKAANQDSPVYSTAPSADPTSAVSLDHQQDKVMTGVENYLGRRVDRRDILTAGNILISRFSWGEINYLYSTGSRGLRNNEEARQVRSLLLSRLSAGDVATLTSLGHKYGLSLKILDASYPIK